MQELISRIGELMSKGEVDRVLGWKTGDMGYNTEPYVFTGTDELCDFVYDITCSANISKLLIDQTKKDGVTLVCLKPCDTFSLNRLIAENRVDRSKVYIIGVGCKGNLDTRKLIEDGAVSVLEEEENLRISTLYGEFVSPKSDYLLERCRVCDKKIHKISDEIIGSSKDTFDYDRFSDIDRISSMSAEERFSFFNSELSRCIRCNACRNACPICSCRKCVFDSEKFDSSKKANTTSFEEKMFHIIRAFHVAGRCTDCGECSRVCPENIPLHLLNRRLIQDINKNYGEYIYGDDVKTPLTSYRTDDPEPWEEVK